MKGKALHAAWDAGHGYDATMYFPGGLDDPDLIAFRLRPEHEGVERQHRHAYAQKNKNPLSQDTPFCIRMPADALSKNRINSACVLSERTMKAVGSRRPGLCCACRMPQSQCGPG